MNKTNQMSPSRYKAWGLLLLGIVVLLVASLVSLGLSSCRKTAVTSFTIIAGSENETLEPIIREFGKQHRVDINVTYKGSVDIMLSLGKPDFTYDAVWPANSLWVTLGDKNRKIKHLKSIMTSPVAFGIRKSIAEQLGYVDKVIRVRDILNDIRSGKLSFMMTSATQSNSGASAYIGFLYALAGNPDVLKLEHLRSPALREDIRLLLSGINRSSGSSGWLKELFLTSDYMAMVNYESVLIETNQELIAQGKEPLYIVYPADGTVLADSPLGYYNTDDPAKEGLFLELQQYLLSEPVQKRIAAQGRRTGIAGLDAVYDPSVFRPEWGIDPKRILTTIRMPSEEVLAEALRLYQTDFRKPSYTIYALDFSGSMAGTGELQLKEAMNLLLDPEQSSVYLLQPGSGDKIIVLPFSNRVLHVWQADGGDAKALKLLRDNINSLVPNGGTDIYTPVIDGIARIIKDQADQAYLTSIVLMTDGVSNTGRNLRDLSKAYKESGLDVPVFCIMFGDASKDQLTDIVELTRARVFDGRKNLIEAFRQVRGYN